MGYKARHGLLGQTWVTGVLGVLLFPIWPFAALPELTLEEYPVGARCRALGGEELLPVVAAFRPQ